MTKRIRSKIARGSGELAILSLLAEQQLYGFEIARQIGERTAGALKFTLASLYPLLYDMEKKGWLEGRWQANQAGRDRRYYRLTPAGRKQLAPLKEEWRNFFQALNTLAGVSHA
ncbi:MAG TPA: helix-turn-helix transcriptional regulator [Candidatus Binatus sp.]|jgi:PadR family transcriptional regulator PadR|nr:helix-turn-helix transcriptional regulator [Candidatus Binatus sp.]